MKKKILCFVFALMMLLVSATTYADVAYYNAGYSVPVKHYFLTGSVSKTTSQNWLQIKDAAIESKKVYSDGTIDNGYHYSRVTDSSGNQLCERKLVSYGGTTYFTATDLGANIGTNVMKLRIDNPFYNGDNTTIKLQTKGNFYGISTAL